MGSSRCGKCGSTSFEVSELHVPGLAKSMATLQCANESCNAVVGLTERELPRTLEASRKTLLEKSFVVDEDDLRKLHATIKEFIAEPKYKVLCADHLEWANYGIEDLLKMENPPDSEITGLQIEARSESPRREMFMALLSEGEKQEGKSNDKEGPNVWVTLEGPSQAVVELNHQINNRLTAMHPWYWWLTSRTKAGWVGLVAIVTGAVFVLSKALYRAQWPSKDTRPMVYIAAWFVVAILLAKLQKGVFPVACFSIGQGVKRQRTREMVQTTVVIAFMVGIASGVVLWLIL